MKQVTENMMFVMHNCIDSDIEKAKKMEKGVTHLMEVLDSVLDKPFMDNPKYACGDFLEELKEALHDFGTGWGYLKRIVVAKATAWSIYPEKIRHNDECDFDYDANEEARNGYVMGYMHATEQ